MDPYISKTWLPEDPETTTDPWDFFDAVYCISLKHRTDRQRQARQEFQKVGLDHKVEFVLVDTHSYDCEQGIFQSHQLCLQKGLRSEADVILVFEDDIVFHGVTPKLIDNIVHFLRTNREWKIFFLGGLIDKAQKTEFSSVIKIRFRCSSHAYAVKGDLARHLISQSWSNVPYDSMLRNEANLAAFAARPGFAFQSSSC
ncbi:MAG: glycosyltransferase, partial [Thermodesulfobacteriota bacterium]